jgi:hypothetical protein
LLALFISGRSWAFLDVSGRFLDKCRVLHHSEILAVYRGGTGAG